MPASRDGKPSPGDRYRQFPLVLGVTLTAFSAAALLLRHLPADNVIALIVTVGVPYLPILAASAVMLTLLSRRRVASLAAVAVLITTLAIQVPWHNISRPADLPPHVDIRVFSSNLRKGQADASFFVAFAERNADVVAVSELTSAAAERLSREGIDRHFPYSTFAPRPGVGEIGLWSRFPIKAFAPATRWNTTIAAARLDIPGVRVAPLIASLHVTSPVASDGDSFDQWRRGIVSIKSVLKDFAHATGPGAVIVAGDFNSTPDIKQFRDLLAAGYSDAGDQAGAVFAPTYPAHRWVPPLVAIDHVLTRNASAKEICTVTVRGADHRAILATVGLPL